MKKIVITIVIAAAVLLAASFGLPLSKYARRSPALQAFRRIAKRIQGFHQPIKLK